MLTDVELTVRTWPLGLLGYLVTWCNKHDEVVMYSLTTRSRRRCCIAFLFGLTMLTNDLLCGLPPTTSTSTPGTGHTSPLTCVFRLAEAQCR
ncbi:MULTISPECIES: ETEC_3214 domain-containing protein [Streptomyces]|uniref:ETEC_3214 domain-containing protein n=1 Tax=Streptomyces TaxID=1883 RepID=UPI00081B69FB|nr:hypothetical protein GA0115247_13175 [Streptomyces sp. PalvLS-984]SDC98863.1 hypothetical protein F558DRAFT_03071 [Streptomyces sp. AmelKG-A3]